MREPRIVFPLEAAEAAPAAISRDAHTRIRAAVSAVAGGRDRVTTGRPRHGLLTAWKADISVRSGWLRGVDIELSATSSSLIIKVHSAVPLVTRLRTILGVSFAALGLAALLPSFGDVMIGPVGPVPWPAVAAGVGVALMIPASLLAEAIIAPIYQGTCRASWVETQALTQRLHQAVVVAVTESNPLLGEAAVRARQTG